ncbi:MFS transporter [Pseudolysinimonas yzui]|uniref:MFS transporter n=1 Tax=Pseudolysinimonas yzui TaxID=2708254 RepID=A0A8J3GSJ7_9MICO|nr:MFS transporter [Pseudolysinimonas yzui]GHF24259.1 MFS transporter [Pseudolysinimonas yzui]
MSSLRTPRPWLMLAVGGGSQAATALLVSTPAYLIPLLHTERGLSLAEAGLLATAPNVGVLLTLILWGAATDRWGERVILVTGLVVAVAGAGASIAAAAADGYVALAFALGLCGVGAAATSATSGRVVIGWFPPERRGLAMGLRQTALPLGTAAGALIVPPLAAGGEIAPPLIVGASVVAVAAVASAMFIVNPLWPARLVDAEGRPANPYRGDATLARIHLVSALLVVPQYALATFGLVWLIVDQRWDPVAAGIVVASAQLLGAGGRVGIGVLSDRLGSRLRPLRWVALAGIPLLLLTAAAGELHWAPAVAVFYILASCVSVADNGLAFTAVAEIAGAHWSGRALGTQNTGQYIASAIVAPAVGALIALTGFSSAFALLALAPAAAIPLVPKDAG